MYRHSYIGTYIYKDFLGTVIIHCPCSFEHVFIYAICTKRIIIFYDCSLADICKLLYSLSSAPQLYCLAPRNYNHCSKDTCRVHISFLYVRNYILFELFSSIKYSEAISVNYFCSDI